MRKSCKCIFVIILIVTFSTAIHSQEKEFEQLALSQKSSIKFPLDHKIIRPRLEYPSWDKDYDKYYSFLTPTLKKTQAALSFNDKGVVTSVIPNAIMLHAQLDTNTMMNNKINLMGTWRMLAFRSIRFNDSVYIPTKTYYRLADTLLADKSNDEAFAVFTDDQFKLFVKKAGKTSFKREFTSKYKIENKRFLMLYKVFKSGAGVSQFGLDERGYLIMNYPKVIENVKKGECFSYYSIIEQYIFEKVK